MNQNLCRDNNRKSRNTNIARKSLRNQDLQQSVEENQASWMIYIRLLLLPHRQIFEKVYQPKYKNKANIDRQAEPQNCIKI